MKRTVIMMLLVLSSPITLHADEQSTLLALEKVVALLTKSERYYVEYYYELINNAQAEINVLKATGKNDICAEAAQICLDTWIGLRKMARMNEMVSKSKRTKLQDGPYGDDSLKEYMMGAIRMREQAHRECSVASSNK